MNLKYSQWLHNKSGKKRRIDIIREEQFCKVNSIRGYLKS